MIYGQINFARALKKIGEQFKISESAVSHAVSRVSKTIAKDEKVGKKIDKLINKLNHLSIFAFKRR